MTGYETYARIGALTRQGLTPAQIAADCGLDERTVRLWQGRTAYRPRRSPKRAGKLDVHRQTVARHLAEHPYSAAQLLRKLREDGYAGGYGILKTLVRQLRPPRHAAYLPLAFAPGECAQVDWGCAGTLLVDGARRRLSFFVMVLCHSRMLYLEFTLLERQEQFLECHQNAFLRFGGVPGRVMVDNLKSAVLSHPRGMPAVYHPRYLDFAAHYGFEARACQPRRANEKGRVENAVGYVKKNFLAGLELTSLAAVQAAGRAWADGVANARLHAATRRRPDELFAEERLRPLPASGVYDTGAERDAVATSLFRVHFDGNRYSVPARHAGTRVSLRAYTDRVLVYGADRRLIATHARAYGRGRDIADPDHGCELVRQRRQARDQHTLQRFLALCGVGILVHYSLMFILAAISFWTVRAQGIVWGYYNLFQIARMPDEAFSGVFKAVFTFALPMLLVSNVPVRLLTAKLTSVELPLILLGLAVGCWFASQWFWRVSLRRYTSASS
jgi:transposase